MRVGVLYSGGKDSAYATYLSKLQGHIVACLITIIPKKPDSFLFHYPNVKWTNLQATSMGLESVKLVSCSEDESKDLEIALNVAKDRFKIEGIVTGGLASKYQKNKFELLCDTNHLKCISPLWLMDPETYMRNLVKLGFKSMIVSVSADGLGQKWLGRIIDNNTIDELIQLNKKNGLNITFEGGEAETFVIDSPLFSKAIQIKETKKHWHYDHGFLEILSADLTNK